MTNRPAITRIIKDKQQVRQSIRQLLADAYRKAKRRTRSKFRPHATPMTWRELRDLARDDYPAYLRTPHWQRTRRTAVLESLWTCQECDARGWNVELQVHHLTYKRLGRERPRDLRVLCENCHREEHES